jgi:hypothetical protein
MNRDEIMKLEAGRELDTLVAEKVMGLTADKEHCPYCGAEMWIGALRSRCSSCSEWRYGWYKNYSDDISAAWEVVEKIREYIECIWPNDRGLWSLLSYERLEEGLTTVSAETAPLAICRAALLAVMGE